MKSLLAVAICLCALASPFIIGVAVFAQVEKPVEKPVPAKPVAVTAEFANAFNTAQARLAESKKALEDSPAYKDYVIAQNNLQAVQLFIMAELGMKPSEECAPVLSKDGKLERFDCPQKPKLADAKPKP